MEGRNGHVSPRPCASGNAREFKMEDEAEEVNPFSFKSFVQGKSIDPPPYPTNIDKKEKQRNRQKSSQRERTINSFHEDQVPFPEVDNLVETQSDSNSAKSSQEYLSCEDISSNGEN